MNLKKKLLHHADLTPVVSFTAYGDKVYGTKIESQQCVFFGGEKRLLDSKGELIQLGYSALFLSTVTSIAIDFLVSNVINKDGITLLNSGRITSCELVDKPKKGKIFYDVWIVKGE